MSLVIVETASEQPLTDAYLEEADRIGLPCLQAHGVTWRYSLLSKDRDQMICIFDAPDAASVRNSYAKLGIQKRAIWAGELIQPKGTQPSPDWAECYVIEAHYPSLGEEEWNKVEQNFSQFFMESGMKWLHSYVSLDRTRVVYELDALDAETIQNAHHRFGIPYGSYGVAPGANRIWSAQLLIP